MACTEFDRPQDKGVICPMCGVPLPPGRTRFCSPWCFRTFYDLFFWAEAVKNALKRAHGKCQVCGLSSAGLEAIEQIRRPEFWQHHRTLQVHHIDPLNCRRRDFSAMNIPSNLLVVCPECHGLEHQKLNAAKKAIIREEYETKTGKQLSLIL
jgi:hypothetical protein